jgi:maleylacetate reductase
MREEDIPRIAEEVTSRSYGNPRPITYDDVVGILNAAWAGKPPSSNPSA